MSILGESIRSARFESGFVVVELRSGGSLRFPIADNPRLAQGTLSQLSRIESSPFGLHWPDLDEDLSLAGLLQNDHGQHCSRPR